MIYGIPMVWHSGKRHRAACAPLVPYAAWKLLILLCVSLCIGGCSEVEQSISQKTIFTVEQMKKLPPQVPSQMHVRLHGVITYIDVTNQVGYLQDATGGVRIDRIYLNSSFTPGDF